jgi:hypothetical protein
LGDGKGRVVRLFRKEAAKRIDIPGTAFYSIPHMALKLRSIIFILAFALLVQNTCPFGAAGMSTVTSPCKHCPLKHSFVVSSGCQKSLVADSSSAHFPLYVFAVPKTVHMFQLIPVNSERPILANGYKDALPHDLLRPPQA